MVCARFVAFPMLVAFIFAFLIPQAGLAQNDPLVGVWKFNAAKSKGYMQWSQVRIIQPSGQGLIQVISSVSDKGHNVTVYTLICDGQPHPVVSFLSDADANTCRRPDPYTREWVNFQNGKRTGGGRAQVVSRDGSTMTITFANGNIAVFDKQ